MNPTNDLVQSNNVDTIIFSTEWWDRWPYTLPHVVESSWAKTLQVNLIASNLHDAMYNNSGSGIFTTEGTIDYHHDISISSEGKLIVSDIPIDLNGCMNTIFMLEMNQTYEIRL